jgi:hypothetical protein
MSLTFPDFYSHPAACRMIGNWADEISQLDAELGRLRVLIALARYLIVALPQGNAIISNAQNRQLTLGQIPLNVLNRLDRLDWTDGTPDHVAHLQVIWRYYLTFEERRALKALQEELVTQAQIPRSQFAIVLSDLRGAQGAIYYDLELRGLNPYALDQMLDQDIDFIEWLLELRLWHYLSAQYNQNALIREGLYQWWLAERSIAATMTADPPQPIGNPQVVLSDMFSLQHGIHDTKTKFMVLMGVVGTHNALSVDDLTQLLVKMTVEPALDPSTRQKVIGALHFAFQGIGSDKLDTAAEAAAAILTGQQPQQAIDKPTMAAPAMSVPSSQQSQAGEGHIIGVTLDSQGFTDFLIHLLTACLELFRTSPNPQRRYMAVLLYNSIEKLQQVNLVQQKSVEILLTANEAMAWAVAWERLNEGEITPQQIPGSKKHGLTMTGLSVDLMSLSLTGQKEVGLNIVRLVK